MHEMTPGHRMRIRNKYASRSGCAGAPMMITASWMVGFGRRAISLFLALGIDRPFHEPPSRAAAEARAALVDSLEVRLREPDANEDDREHEIARAHQRVHRAREGRTEQERNRARGA